MLNLIQAATAAKGGGFDWSMIIMLVAMFAIVYFFMIRPQKKRQKEIENFRKSLTMAAKSSQQAEYMALSSRSTKVSHSSPSRLQRA